MIYPRTYRNASPAKGAVCVGRRIDMTNPAQKPAETKPAADLKPIQTKHLAAKFGIKATALRRVLRSMAEYADGVHTNYRWAEKDPAIARIEAKLKQMATDKAKRAEEAKAALAKRAAEAAAANKADAAK